MIYSEMRRHAGYGPVYHAEQDDDLELEKQMTRVVMMLVVAVLTFSSQSSWAQNNPFGTRSTPPQSQPERDILDESPQKPLITVPAPMRAMFRQIADWQRDLNRFLSGKLRESSSEGSFAAAIAVLFASFTYGVLHAAGPGHGKMVVASYFTAKQAPLKTGILMGSVIAITQAVVAISVVGILALIVGRSQMQIMDDANWLEIVSYAIIFGMGAYMTYCAFLGREAFAHDHGPAASTFDGDASTQAHHDHHHNHDHHHHHHGEHCAHEHGHHGHNHHDHDHHDHGNARETWLAKAARTIAGRDGEVIAVGVVSGVRPCTGSILVLLFALANGVFWLGIAAALLIAFGVAITISALGIGMIVLRRAIAGTQAQATPTRALLNRALTIAGSAGVMLLGGLLLGGALSAGGLL